MTKARKIRWLLRARSPPTHCQKQPKPVKAAVSRCKAVCAHPAGWVASPCPSRPLKRGVWGVWPRVCKAGFQEALKPYRANSGPPTHHFFTRFSGQGRGSILQRDKGRWSLRALLPGNTAPQRGSGMRWRWSLFGLLVVVGGRNHQKIKGIPTVGRFSRWPP